jgi:hypothetical protein
VLFRYGGTNTDAARRSLTTGTSRKPISVRSTYDHQALDWRVFPGRGTATDCRDFRLGIVAQVHEATNRGLDKPFKTLDQFFKEIDELMVVFNHARNVVQPLRCEPRPRVRARRSGR